MQKPRTSRFIKLSPKESSIIRFLRFNPGKTTAEIIKALNLKRANSYNLLSALYDHGLLICGRSSSHRGDRGRIPEKWYVNSEYGYVLGVEFWNWLIVAGLLDFSGKILFHKSTRIPTGFIPHQDNDLARKAVTLMREVVDESGIREKDILGIGLFAPG